MAGNQTGSDGTVRPRVAASSARLTSLRTSTDASAAPARRPKFVPKAAKRRPASEGRAEGSATGPQRSNDVKPHSSGAGSLKNDNRGRGGRGRGGRGGGRGRGRGRGVIPSGKVAFVGTLSGGSSYSGGGSAPAPRATPAADFSAAGGTGISVLDDEEMPGGKQPEGMEVDEVWPPVVKSVMEPMSLPIVRPPEPQNAGAVFCDTSGDVVAPDDSLFFIQMPTTLPLSSAITKGPAASTDEDESMESTEEAKEETKKRNPEESPDDGVFDHSIETAPGGFVGKICVHKSGKMVLVLGDKQFEVAAAQTPSFCEEIYAVNTTEKHLSMLGNVERHLVVTPDFEVLLH